MKIDVTRRPPLVLALVSGAGEPDAVVGSAAARAAAEAFGAGPALSISHRDGRAAAAAAVTGMRVGVDLERTGSVPRARERYFLTRRERRSRGRPEAAVLWALKEAAWKAFRCEATLPFTELELELTDHGDVRAVRVRGARYAARSEVRRVWGEYVLAVVWAEAVP